MNTVTASGWAAVRDTRQAVDDAIRNARTRLRDRTPTFGFVFASPDHDLSVAMSTANGLVDGATMMGTSTAGELTEEGLVHGGIAVLLVSTPTSMQCAVIAQGLKGDVTGVADRLVRPLGELRRAATGQSLRHLSSVLLTDGLAGTGENLVNEMRERAGSMLEITGGAAGDEARFAKTCVAMGTEVASDAAAVLHVASAKPWGIGVNHGLRPSSKKMRVTRANGNVVREIDGAPAFDAYRQHAADRGVSLNRDNAGPYMIANEIGLLFFDKLLRARAPLSVTADGALTCAAAIPEGAMIAILDGEPTSMIDAAKSAAQEALEHLDGSKAAGVLLFDCVCRGMILRHEFQKEIDAVRSVFGDVPVAGFLTYGEIARYRGRLEGWHNATAVVAAIPE